MRAESSTIVITKVALNVDFTAIWEKYAYKVGDKKRAQKLWAQLTEGEKIACLQSLTRYDAYLARTGVAKCLLTTYLSQRRWENQF